MTLIVLYDASSIEKMTKCGKKKILKIIYIYFWGFKYLITFKRKSTGLQ